MWAFLAVALIGLPFLSLPGRYAFDTHDLVWFHPGPYLARAFSLWRATPYLGQEQHDGIIVPMAVTVWLFRSVGLSVWVAERLWHGLLLFSAAGSTILLVDALRGRKTVVAPVVAGLVYGLTPYSIGYGLPFTPVWLPYVLLPLLLVVTLRGARRGSLGWAALFGFVTFLMGGGNGAPQAFVLLMAFALLAWLVFGAREVPLATVARFALWSLVFFAGMNAYWLLLLKSPEVSNALQFSEQPNVINVSSSAAEAVRGLGFWQFYGGDPFGPWLAPVRPYVTNPLLVLTTFAVPAGAFVSAWLVRWRYRLFFVLVGVLAIFLSVGLFPVASPSAFGHLLSFLYDHVPGFAGLRTTYKVTAELAISLAVLGGIGIEALISRAARSRRRLSWPAVALAAAVVVIAANAYPLWSGRLYNEARTAPAVPAYWNQALRTLDQREQAYRTLFAPSTSWTTYTWGSLKESITQTDPALNSVYPLRLPVGLRYGSNLVAAVEGPYLNGSSPAGTAQLLRYLGIGDVVLQNDIDWRRSNSPRPADMQALLGDPQIQKVMSFGAPGENVLGSLFGGAATSTEPSLAPVEVLSVSDPVPMIRAEDPSPMVLSGDGFGIAGAASQGMLSTGPPILYSGALTPTELGRVLNQQHPTFVVTDTNRRRVWSFSAPRAPHSWTLPTTMDIGGRPIGYLLFDDSTDTQSFAVYPGVRSISSSTATGAFGGPTQYRPANAFDGDPSSWWAAGFGSDPVGAWVQIRFDKPTLVSSLTLSQPGTASLRLIRAVRVGFSDGSTVPGLLSRGRRTTITFPSRLTTSVRVRVTRVGASPSPGRLPPVAISDIALPDIHPTETIVVPTDLFDTARQIPGGLARLAGSPITYLFERAGASRPGGAPEETRVVRRFEIPGQASYTLLGSAHLDRSAGDGQIEQALLGPQPVEVSSSSRYLGNPVFRGTAAFDGDPNTEWVPAGTTGEWLDMSFPRRTLDHIQVDTSVGSTRGLIQRIKAVFAGGTTVYGEPSDPRSGVITLNFPAVSTDRLTLFVDQVFAPFGGKPLPVGIREVHIPNLSAVREDHSAPLPCLGTVLSIDGRPVFVRPEGTVGDLLSGKDLPLVTCSGRPIALAPGSHDLLAGGVLQPDAIRLSTLGQRHAAVSPATLPRVEAPVSWTGSYQVNVSNARGPFYLVIGQNYDPRWKASIDGRDLGPPELLDGYSAGWLISRPGSYAVSVRYGPQRTYTLALGVTGVSLFAGAAAIATDLRRRRRRSRRRR
jgi:arabinofuranan 3-O-arabinosyltransferase